MNIGRKQAKEIIQNRISGHIKQVEFYGGLFSVNPILIFQQLKN
jgi:hypothetical protein